MKIPTREEQFYEVAAREVSEEKLAQGTWGKAFSLAAGDDQKAKALYIKLRVGQQGRDHRQAVADLLRESRKEITTGKAFVCPHCEARTTARFERVDFFVQVFTEAPAERYRCQSCAAELDVSGAPAKANAAAPEAPATGPDEGKVNNRLGLAGFVLGLASTDPLEKVCREVFNWTGPTSDRLTAEP
jgi:hypothetical protein